MKLLYRQCPGPDIMDFFRIRLTFIVFPVIMGEIAFEEKLWYVILLIKLRQGKISGKI